MVSKDFLVLLLKAAIDVGALDWEVRKLLVAMVEISCLFRNAGLSIRWLSSMIAGSDEARYGGHVANFRFHIYSRRGQREL